MVDRAGRLGAHRAWRAEHSHRALTEDEIGALPEGARVEIAWSGGNGPAVYVVDEQSEWGTWVRVEGMEGWADRGRVREPLRFTGAERYHTVVVPAEAVNDA